MIAYLILVHRYPDQFKRLFKTIYHHSNHYLIHVDKRSGPELQQEIADFLADYPNAAMLPSKNALWGGYSLVDAELRGIAALLEQNQEWEFFINLKKYNSLSPENKAILDAATRVAAADMTAKYQMLNPIALKKLVANKTQLKPFSKELMDAGFKASMEVFAEHEAKSPTFKKVHQDMRAFQRDQILWNRCSELPFNQYMSNVKV